MYFDISFVMLRNMILNVYFKNGVLKITVIMTTTEMHLAYDFN